MRPVALVLVWLATLWPHSAAASPTLDEHGVRTGTHELEPTDSVESRREAPSDAPRSHGGTLRLPDVPAGFNTYDGGWIKFVYHPSIRERVQPLIADAAAVRTQLTEWLGQPVLHEVRVSVARTPGEMATLAPPNAPYPDYAAGVAYPEIGLVLLTVKPIHPSSNHDLNEVFRHELAHIALEDAVAGRPVPRWFNEGFAVLASGETSYVRLQTLWTATVSNSLLTLPQMERSFPADENEASIAYAQAADVLRFLVRREERHRFRGLVSRMRDGESMDTALLNSYGEDASALESEWREEVARRYTFWPVLFSGTVIWAGTLGLFVVGWRRKRRKAADTLARWQREEAVEDEARRRLAFRADSGDAGPRVHIVLSRAASFEEPHPSVPPAMLPRSSDVEVPKVEHDGQWHTLH